MARFARGVLFLAASAVALVGFLGGNTYAQTFAPQPYLVYEVLHEPLPQVVLVDLQDQFIYQQGVQVEERWYLMNPVEKTPLPSGQTEPITDLNLHYRWYTIFVDDPGIVHSVKVTNQFGDMMPWTIQGAPRFLLAPASKVLASGDPPPPPPGNHYDCYEVVEAPPAGAFVDLDDQFDPHPSADVMIARYLCAPTVKTKQGEPSEIFQATDGRDHLACYDIPQHLHSEAVNTRTQFTDFEPDYTQVNFDLLLCVPSKKTREFDAQPYIVYDVPPEPLEPQPVLVDLADQFITEQNVEVLERWYLMNPVEKTPADGQMEPITDPALHYRWHTIVVDDPGITRLVKVSNQFGSMVRWTITGVPRFLLAPASKLDGGGDPPPPPLGNHYDCYEAVDAPLAGAIVALNDQFGAHGAEPLQVTNPRYLCAPVIKTKDGVESELLEARHGRDHLACYEIPAESHIEPVTTRTQFTGVDPDVIQSEDDVLLCVPSRKTFPVVPSLAPWGIAGLGVLMLLMLFWVARRRTRYGGTG